MLLGEQAFLQDQVSEIFYQSKMRADEITLTSRAAGSHLQVRQAGRRAAGQGKSGWQKMHSPSVVTLAH